MTNSSDVPIAGSILDLHGERCENGCKSSVVFVLAGRHICAECYLRYAAPIAPAAPNPDTDLAAEVLRLDGEATPGIADLIDALRNYGAPDPPPMVAHVLAALDELEKLRTSAPALARRVQEMEDDRKRALKRADELTLDTQTCEEAVTALVSTTRVARADADRLRARVQELEGEVERLQVIDAAVINLAAPGAACAHPRSHPRGCDDCPATWCAVCGRLHVDPSVDACAGRLRGELARVTEERDAAIHSAQKACARTCEHTWDDVAVATACGLCGAVRLEADLARVTAERDEALSQRDEAQRMEGLAARAVEAVRGQLAIAWDERDEARRDLAVAVTACEGWQADLAAATRVVEVARRVVRAQNAIAARLLRSKRRL